MLVASANFSDLYVSLGTDERVHQVYVDSTRAVKEVVKE